MRSNLVLKQEKNGYQNIWNSCDMGTFDFQYIDDLEFDINSNKLKFIIKNFHAEPKVARYRTVNYVKYPIYEGFKERTKVIRKFDKEINVYRFLNIDILQMNIEKDEILEIIEEVGQIPEWRKKEIEIEILENKIYDHENLKRDYDYEKKGYFELKYVDYKEKNSNFWLRLLFVPFTFGLSFLGFISKKQAIHNKKLNNKNNEWNNEYKIKIDNENSLLYDEIQKWNKNKDKLIQHCLNEIDKIKNKELVLVKKHNKSEWYNLKEASNIRFLDLINQKGIYIIKNIDKDKYYVGQSKNIGKRLCDHFKNGTVNNIIFAKDWYNGDKFVFKWIFCETKDELDRLEKSFIEQYNSFSNGYNKTGGNI